MPKPKVILEVSGESSELDCPMNAVQIIAEIIAENWDNEKQETIVIIVK